MALKKVEFATEYLGNDNNYQTYRQVREGLIPPGVAVWIGRQLRFDEDALREWHRRGGTPLDSQNNVASALAEAT